MFINNRFSRLKHMEILDFQIDLRNLRNKVYARVDFMVDIFIVREVLTNG